MNTHVMTGKAQGRCAKGWAMFDRARELMPLGTGTNSKAAVLREDDPAYLCRGQGAYVYDMDGHQYIDYRNALGPVTLGYAYAPVNDAIRRQLDDGVVFSFPHPLELEVAEKAVELIPCAEQVRFLKTGGEAMAGAIKLARAYTGRDRILSAGYHGWLQTYAGQRGVPEAVANHTTMYTYGDTQRLRELLVQHRGEVAAITLAPAYAAMHEADTFACEVRALADEFDTLLLFDEIVTGFRLAIGGYQAYYGVTPDLAVFSKGIANGMPLSVIAGRRDIMRSAETNATISSTFSGEALSLASAKATMHVYETEPVIEHMWRLGTILCDGIQRIFEERSVPAKMYGLPPCPMICFQTGDVDRNALLYRALTRGLYRRGVSIYQVLYISYALTEADVHETLSRFDDACAHLDEQDGETDIPYRSASVGVAAFNPAG